MSKHIVFVIGNYKNGGVAMRATNLANSFSLKGYKCTLLITGEVAENTFFSINDNVEIIALDEYFKKHASDVSIKMNLKRRTKIIRFLKLSRYITKYFSKIDKYIEFIVKWLRYSEKLSAYLILNHKSVYIAFGLTYFINLYFASIFTKTKLVYAERNAPEVEYPCDCDEKKKYLHFVKKAKKIIVQTQNAADFYKNVFDNVVVINNPVKPNLPQRYTGERKKTVVNFCRISQQKNLPLLINSFIKFHGKYPDYKLEIYGNTVTKQEDELKTELQAFVEESGESDYIKILPPCADVHKRIVDYAMFISTSDFEGLSNSMLEAMAIGLPCICTDCLGGGAREVIDDGINGILIPINNEETLYKAMCNLAGDIELQKNLSNNAAKINQTHSIETISNKWIKIIEAIQ